MGLYVGVIVYLVRDKHCIVIWLYARLYVV